MRQDKHLLPIEYFKDKDNKKVVDDFTKLPFQSIDLIFNHKNISANLQNPDPAVIYYHIHENTKWLPLIADPSDEHPLIIKLRKMENGDEEDNELDIDNQQAKALKKPKGKKTEERLIDMKDKGSYMQPFASFYDPKAMSPPLS